MTETFLYARQHVVLSEYTSYRNSVSPFVCLSVRHNPVPGTEPSPGEVDSGFCTYDRVESLVFVTKFRAAG